jgi:mannose/cellobiose epimerase-like protein (N-acyl-D-glucosamine 2-epimerase family)
VESWTENFTVCEPYRGANSNMHSVEAYLAAGDVSADPIWHQRALAIAERIINQHARGDDWRIPEHFDATWTPRPDFNKDRPDDRFRPFGTTPGHSLEWARLLLGLKASLPTAPAWLAEASVGLFDAGVADGWFVDGHEGFVYTVGPDRRPIVGVRMHWVACEGVLAAEALHRHTGQQRFANLAATFWQHIADHFVDRVGGGWFNELTAALEPAHTVWPGKPDLYHTYQALIFPSLPVAPCGAVALAAQRR